MYRQLFGFKKNPFRQPTDSERLFLGRHHEEALAHLTYAVMEGEGFSVITGESGVGKTTVCRSFVERLNQEVVAAYIAAMTGLGPLQLLKAINTEFKARSDIDTIKDLTDALNAFLIQKKREGRKVALFIDDAQLLSTAALEQVRLLSNLETTRDKMLQIVLIGRPALSKMLGEPSLRQIGQRVSVNYFINPLDYEETVAYIQHRISISSAGPPVRFDQAAIRPIYKFTKGIPRKINIACDRILTAAYKYRERTITKKTVKDVLRQWHKGPDLALYYLIRQNLPAIAIAVVLMLTAVVSSMYLFGGKKTDSPTVAIGPKTDRPAPRKPSQPPPAPVQAEPVAAYTPPGENAPRRAGAEEKRGGGRPTRPPQAVTTAPCTGSGRNGCNNTPPGEDAARRTGAEKKRGGGRPTRPPNAVTTAPCTGSGRNGCNNTPPGEDAARRTSAEEKRGSGRPTHPPNAVTTAPCTGSGRNGCNNTPPGEDAARRTSAEEKRGGGRQRPIAGRARLLATPAQSGPGRGHHRCRLRAVRRIDLLGSGRSVPCSDECATAGQPAEKQRLHTKNHRGHGPAGAYLVHRANRRFSVARAGPEAGR